MRLAPGVNDEGTLVYGALRVAQGQVPSRDFVEGIAPGSFYWLAMYFKLLGATWFATRVSLLVTTVSIMGLMYLLARRLRLTSALTPAICLIATLCGPLWPQISHHSDSTLFALLAFSVFVYWLDVRQRIGLLLLAGILAGLTTCFLQQKGILLFLSFVAVLWLQCRREARFRSRLGWLTGGYAAVGGTFLFLFWRAGALCDLIYANAIFPLTRYGNVNSVSYGTGIFNFYWHRWTVPLNAALSPAAGYSIAGMLVVPFLFVAALPILLAAFAVARRRLALNQLTAAYWLCGAALWASELQRKDIFHLVFGSPLLILLCLHLYESLRNTWTIRALRLLAACACFLAVFNALVEITARTPIATRRGVMYGHRKDPVLDYLNAHIPPGEETFVYPYHPMYYFLLDAPNATRYSFLVPGYHTEEQFGEAVAALESKQIKHAVWGITLDDPRLALVFPHLAPAPPVMEPYLARHYSAVYANDGVQVLERKDSESK